MLVQIQQWAPLGSGYPESGRGSIPQGRCVRLAVQWFKLSFISLVTDSAGKDKAPPPVRLRKQGRVAPGSSVLDVPRISRVSLYKVCKSRRYKLKLVEVWIASSLPHQYPSSDGMRSRSSRARGNRSAPRPYTGSGGKPPLWAKFMG